MNRIFAYEIVGILILSVIGVLLPRWLFLPGILIGAVIFNELFTETYNNSQKFDLLLLGSYVCLACLPALFVKSVCLIFPGLFTCTTNQIRGTLFLLFYFPLIPFFGLWVVFRLPILIRKLRNKLF